MFFLYLLRIGPGEQQCRAVVLNLLLITVLPAHTCGFKCSHKPACELIQIIDGRVSKMNGHYSYFIEEMTGA